MSLFLSILFSLVLTGTGPKLDLELVHTPIVNKRVDLFLSVYNPNPYSIMIPRNPCPAQIHNKSDSGSGELTHVDCIFWEYPKDFIQLESKQRMIFPIMSEIRVPSGKSSITVDFSNMLAKSSAIPDEDEVVLEYRKLKILITSD